MSWSFGINDKHSVAVVDASISDVIVMNASVTRSEIKLAKTTTIALVITTRYTDTPIYCESLSAGMVT